MSVEQTIRRKFQNKVRKTKGRNGIEFKVCCPFCVPPDKKYKLYINPEKYGGVYNCYKCGKSGTMTSLLGQAYKQQIKQAQMTASLKEEPLPEDVPTPGLSTALTQLDSTHPAIEYLTKTRKRPFDPGQLETEYGVRYCWQGRRFGRPESGFFYDTTNTLLFPVWMFNRLVGWQSRLLYDPEHLDDTQCASLGYPKDEDSEWIRPPKYYTNPGLQKGRVLFNFDGAREFDYVVVTEGVFDAMSVGQAAVATFGKGITEQQAKLLKTYWNTVIILLDPGDTSAESERLISELHRAVDVVHINLEHYKDAGDAPRDEIWKQIADTMRRSRKSFDDMQQRRNALMQDMKADTNLQWRFIDNETK